MSDIPYSQQGLGQHCLAPTIQITVAEHNERIATTNQFVTEVMGAYQDASGNWRYPREVSNRLDEFLDMFFEQHGYDYRYYSHHDEFSLDNGKQSDDEKAVHLVIPVEALEMSQK